MVSPYSFGVPGGVQGHIVDLAHAVRALGHEVDVLAPAEEDAELPDFVTAVGRSVGIPYNGSVARLSFGPVSFARVRRWISEHDFDVLHLHEPTAPSLSMLALMVADGPIVATFHTANPRSRALSAFQSVLQPFLEKITARIAVSELARRVQVEHLGGDAVEIPNGVDVGFYSNATPLRGYPRDGGTIGFVGRFNEPRKGMPVLLQAARQLLPSWPELRLLVVGGGDAAALRRAAGYELAEHLVLLGSVDDETKAGMLRGVDVYCAPHTGGESFGLVLTAAMAAGACVVASDLDAFRRVLGGGDAGVLVPAADAAALAAALRQVLADPERRRRLQGAAGTRVAAFDWPVVAEQVIRVYETAVAATPGRVHEAGEAAP